MAIKLISTAILLASGLSAAGPSLVDGPYVGTVTRSSAVVSWSVDTLSYARVKWGLTSSPNSMTNSMYLQSNESNYVQSAPVQGTPGGTTIWYEMCSNDGTDPEACFGPYSYRSAAAAAAVPADPAPPTPVDTPAKPSQTSGTCGTGSGICSVGPASGSCNDSNDGLVATWNMAARGDIIELPPGMICAGFLPYKLGPKPGTGYILIRTRGIDTAAPGYRRIQPSDLPNLARIIHNSPNFNFNGANPSTARPCYAGTLYYWQGQSPAFPIYRCDNSYAQPILSVASSSSPASITLTVASTSQFVSGDMAHISGATGAAASQLNQDWTLTVVNGTTVTLAPVVYGQPSSLSGAASGGAIAVNVYQQDPHVSMPNATSLPSTCTFGSWYHDDSSTDGVSEFNRTWYCEDTNNTLVPARIDYQVNQVTGAYDEPYTQGPLDIETNAIDYLMIQGISMEYMPLKGDPQTLQYINGVGQAMQSGLGYSSIITSGIVNHHIYLDQILAAVPDPSVTGGPAIRVFQFGTAGNNWHIGNSYFSGFQEYGGLTSESDNSSLILDIEQAVQLELVNNHFECAGICVYFTEAQPSTNYVSDVLIRGNEFVRPDKYWVPGGPLTGQGMVFSGRHQLEFKHGNRVQITGNTFTGGHIYINNAAHICLCTRGNPQQAQISNTAVTLYPQSLSYGGYYQTDLHPGDLIGFAWPGGGCASSDLYKHIYTVATVTDAYHFTLAGSGVGSTLTCTGTVLFVRLNSRSGFISDVLASNNTYQNGPEGIDMLGSDSYSGVGTSGLVSGTMQRIKIANNLIIGDDSCRIGQGSQWYPNLAAPSGSDIVLQTGGIEDLQIIHNTELGRTNTCEQTNWFQSALFQSTTTGAGLTIRDNVGEFLTLGSDFLNDSNNYHGKATLDGDFGLNGNTYNYASNVVMRVGGGSGAPYDPSTTPWGPYPNGTIWFNGNYTSFPFFNPAGNYRIQSTSSYASGGGNRATDGMDAGADVNALEAAQGKVSNVHAFSVSGAGASIGFYAPDTYGCPVDWSTNGFATYTRVSNGGGSRVQNVVLPGLPAHSTISYRVQCVATQPAGVFSTP